MVGGASPAATPSTRQAPVYVASSVDIWALGIATVICGQFFSWNVGLVAGTVSFGYGVLLTALAFLCLVLSVAEIASALPFVGGVFGLARCTLGFCTAFVVGCCELMQYVTYSSVSLVGTTQVLSQRWPSLEGFEPLIWIVIQSLVFLIMLQGGRLFWRTIFGLATVSLVVVFFYCLSAMTNADMGKYTGGSDLTSQGGLSAFFQAFPNAIWFFSGIEALATLSTYVEDPCKSIPKGQIASLCTLLASCCCIYLSAISLPPGAAALPDVFAVLNGGFSAGFATTDDTATLFSLPAIVASIPGFSLASSNLLTALAKSNLISSVFSPSQPPPHKTTRPLLVVSVLNVAVCFVMQYIGTADVVYTVVMILGFGCYITQSLAFISWRKRHNRVPRLLVSPVGTVGAMLSVVVFAMGLVSALFCQNDSFHALIATGGVISVLTAYYHGIAKQRQTFSKEEHVLLFFGHVDTSMSVLPSERAGRWQRLLLLVLTKGRRRGHDTRQPTIPKKFWTIAPSLLTQRSEPRTNVVHVGRVGGIN
ncbi:hypothetical protein H257_06840 [Aphanomyces astaci]|uniref:Amino acid permease/ SLC12A domain-containing protein n=2 Tax=Aphanomyces astaci TaxID=112090 RepID=W4GIR7_APHAT|nr:hypothetical protein H257_06840 [Aphanomyces astaci]ETV79580.1 hypothetical protein H257_06840 [Aphanomyces astaci]|eukprot:XP_009830516.1 hypothetical protein H257_06840 [Aphanomyces astaci]